MTRVPWLNEKLQVPPQLIPAGLLATVPVPVLLTLSVMLRYGIDGDRKLPELDQLPVASRSWT